VSAQETLLQGPVSGLVFDQATRALRPVNGVPGAAYLGAQQHSGDAGFVAPNSAAALVLESDSLTLYRDARATRLDWQGSLDAAAFSANAVAAAGSRVRLYRNDELIELASPDGPVRALAIDSSERAAVAVTGSGVWYLQAGEARLVAALDATGLALQGSNLYVADRTRNEVLVIHNFAEAPETARLAGDFDQPVGIALSRDGRLVLADRTSVCTLNASTGERLERVELDFTPARVESLGGDLFRLDGRTQDIDPVQIATLEQGLRVYFVPGKAAEE
jgi:hypothetical protein